MGSKRGAEFAVLNLALLALVKSGDEEIDLLLSDGVLEIFVKEIYYLTWSYSSISVEVNEPESVNGIELKSFLNQLLLLPLQLLLEVAQILQELGQVQILDFFHFLSILGMARSFLDSAEFRNDFRRRIVIYVLHSEVHSRELSCFLVPSLALLTLASFAIITYLRRTAVGY